MVGYGKSFKNRSTLGLGSVSARQQFVISRSDALVFSSRISKKLSEVFPTEDFTHYYELNPDGSTPHYIRLLRSVLARSKEGAVHAYQNQIDVAIIARAFLKQGTGQMSRSFEMNIDELLPAALRRLGEGDSQIQDLLEKFDITFHSAKIKTTERASVFERFAVANHSYSI